MSPFNPAYAGRSLIHEPITKAAGQGPEEGCSTIGSDTLPTLMTFSADLLNLTLPITNATHRGCRSQDSENVPTSLPFIDAWDADSEEAKALHDMGIEDPDAEQEEEVFCSIPGFDDEWPEEDALPKSDEEERGLESSSCTEVETGLNNALIDLKGEQCHVTMRGDNVSVLSISKPEIDTNRITKANSESPAVSLYECSIARFVEGPSRFHIVNEGDDSCAGGLDARVQGDSERSLARPVSASKSRSSVLQQIQDTEDLGNRPASPSTRPLRTSARLRAAAKHPRERTPEDLGIHCPEKRRRIVSATTSAVVRTPSTRGTKSKTKDHKQESRENEGDSESSDRRRVLEPMDSQALSAKQGPERSGRIPQTFLEACIVAENSIVICGIRGCGHSLVVKKPREARLHVKSHYKQTQLTSTETRCMWEGCGLLVKTGKHADGLMRHHNEAHLGLRYGCPGECTDRHGRRRLWARTDELTRHERNDPCEYLQKNPLPRSK